MTDGGGNVVWYADFSPFMGWFNESNDIFHNIMTIPLEFDM